MVRVPRLEETAEDLMRAVGGGLILGIPLLYTMEVWWLGETATPVRTGTVLVLTMVPVAVLSATTGFRRRGPVTPSGVVVDTVEAVGIGLLLCAGILVLLQRITTELSLTTAVQMVVFETAPFAVGAAAATQFFSGDPGRSGRGGGRSGGRSQQTGDRGQGRATVRELGATAIGALAVGLSIAPTDEVPMLTNSISEGWLVLVVAASLVLSYGIVFVAGFADKDRRLNTRGLLQRPLSETASAYVVALVVAAAMLWMFDNLQPGDPLGTALQRTVVMGLPASIGGAAGRLAV